MMKAIVVPRPGATDALALAAVPVPTPGPGEVLVRLRAVGVGVHDRWFLPLGARYPYPIGIEGSGTVEAVGPGGDAARVGERVMFVSSGQPNGGTWAAFAVVAERALVAVPEGLGFEQAAALPVAGGTALASARLLGLAPGSTVFMAGASGAIGTIAVQLARAAGARVAASASPANHAYLHALGADLAVDYRDPGMAEKVRAWSGGAGVDAALAIQPGTGEGCLRLVRDGGRVVTVSGDRLAPERGVEVTQVYVGPDGPARLAGEVAAGRLRVEVEQVFPFARGIEALEKTETRHARGKVVLAMP